MEAQKQVLHFQAKCGFTTAQSNEHQRRWTENGWERANENGRIDRSRTRLNFEIAKGGKVQAVDQSRSIPEKFAENLAARGIKDPNRKWPDEPRYRTVVDFIISGSHDTLRDLAFGTQEVDYSQGADNSGLERRPEIERWAKDMYDALSGKFGEENILSFIVHLDERTPHIHADLVPVTQDGRISFSKVFCGPDKYEFRRRSLALHDLFAEVNRKWGLQRGDSVAVTHAKKKSHEEYRRELSAQCSSLEREVIGRTARLKGLDRQIRLATVRIKGLRTMVSNLETGRARIEVELEGIRRSLSGTDAGTDGRDALLRKEESLQRKLDDILAKLADKQGKLKAADRALADLKEQLSQSKERQAELEREIQAATSKVSKIALSKVGEEALWGVLNEFRAIGEDLPEEMLDRFDDSLLQDMSRRGMQIVTCAALLSMGLVDQATTFAQNCGGGGGHAHGKWGRDPEEDERAWLLRCLARSRQMIAPAGRKIKR